ncbi:SoxR reducing system RseC family protein [Methylogaea oryzae]|uniref:Fis family transcriptional regulator n=1 Tax=Methylogaea oryzae TaxID=1295382 RepID=A0A8D4VLK8_9GAMM|nr:SoxR reducing system RseC family protein [Methylogaea oryzae]BBL70055.1 hypothetical protein MoryE10_06610 [Methylogaea oryzae]
MLEEQVTVTAVDGATAWVEAAVSPCGGCSQVCSSALLQKHLGKNRAPLAVRSPLLLKPGDRVVIGIDERALLWGSLLVYVLPLCGLLAGAVLAESLAVGWGGIADWPAPLGGVFGFAVSVVAVKKLPKLGAAALQPVVLRKISL